MVDLVKLEELAKAATPGPWKQHLVDDTTVICPQREICCTFAEGGLNDDLDFNSDTEQFEADAAFIAAANPAAILELLAEIERLREALTPFAKEAFRYEPPEGDDDMKAWDSQFSIGQLRRAAAIIREQEE